MAKVTFHNEMDGGVSYKKWQRFNRDNPRTFPPDFLPVLVWENSVGYPQVAYVAPHGMDSDVGNDWFQEETKEGFMAAGRAWYLVPPYSKAWEEEDELEMGIHYPSQRLHTSSVQDIGFWMYLPDTPPDHRIKAVEKIIE